MSVDLSIASPYAITGDWGGTHASLITHAEPFLAAMTQSCFRSRIWWELDSMDGLPPQQSISSVGSSSSPTRNRVRRTASTATRRPSQMGAFESWTRPGPFNEVKEGAESGRSQAGSHACEFLLANC